MASRNRNCGEKCANRIQDDERVDVFRMPKRERQRDGSAEGFADDNRPALAWSGRLDHAREVGGQLLDVCRVIAQRVGHHAE